MTERPLGAIEAALTLTNQVHPLTALVALRLQPGPPPAILRQALDRIQARHPMLRTRILERSDGFVFSPMDPATPIPLDVREREDDAHTRSVVEDLLNRRIDPEREPLMRCVYLVPASPNAPADLLCAFHHAAMDAASACGMLNGLLVHCAALVEEDTVEFQATAPLPLQPSADDLLPSGYSGLGLVRRLVPFLGRQVREEVRYRIHTGGGTRPPLLPPSPCRVYALTLSETETRDLVRRSRGERVTLHGTITAALLLALYGRRYRSGTPLMRHVTFANLRPYLHPAVDISHMGCYLSMLRIAVPVSEQDTLWTLARSVDTTLYTANKRGDRFVSALLSRRLMRFMLRADHMRMGDTALSYAGPLPFARQYGPIRVEAVHGYITPNRLSPELAAFGHLTLGRLTVDLMALEADLPRDQAQALTDSMRARLTPSTS